MPAWVVEIFRSNYEAFLAKPILFLLALIAGAVLGHWFSKSIHKSKIDVLEERVKLKSEQIEVKDQAIQSMSSDRARLEQAALQSPATGSTPAISIPPEPKRTAADGQFAAVNAQITNATEHSLRELLLSSKFDFVFNPTTGGTKQITFLPSGDIGEGRNNNENRWRIADGRLEILSADGAVYSRFVLLDDNMSLHHTNDPDTRSLRGQYIKRLQSIIVYNDPRSARYHDG